MESNLRPASTIADAQSGLSWAAIAAGAVAAAALTLLLVSFGAGLGLSAISPWSDSVVSASTFKVGTGIYLIIVGVMSSAVGGYLAGRLRTKWGGVHTNEVFFRDTAHGFLAWALRYADRRDCPRAHNSLSCQWSHDWCSRTGDAGEQPFRNLRRQALSHGVHPRICDRHSN